MKFELTAISTESILVRYFEKDLKPSIKAEIDQDNSQELDYEKQVAKAVISKAKAGLQTSFYIQETHLDCFRGN